MMTHADDTHDTREHSKDQEPNCQQFAEKTRKPFAARGEEVDAIGNHQDDCRM